MPLSRIQKTGMDFPEYSYADETLAPTDLGIRRELSIGAVVDSVTGMNYYVDTLAFGSPTGLSALRGGVFSQNKPLGVDFFADTGLQCSNGAAMHEYISTIPKGDGVGQVAGKKLKRAGLPSLRGIAPGILEDAKDGLNPLPFFEAAQSSGFPACKLVTFAVGDMRGSTRSVLDPSTKKWIRGKIDARTPDGRPAQSRWILDRWIPKEEWDATPKTEAEKQAGTKWRGTYDKQGNAVDTCLKQEEGFTNQHHASKWTAVLILSVLAVGLIVTTKAK